MKKRLLSIALYFVMAIISLGVFSANAANGVATYNFDAQSYSGNWADPVTSHLVATGNAYERAEYVSGQGLLIEKYDNEFNYQSGFYVDLELPIYGGVYYHHNFNFLITGQYNLSEDNSVEVFRITKYDKNWNRLGACSIKAADTSTPFVAGTVRCADAQGKLYVRTCHEMYTSSDGKRHQSTCTFAIDMFNMKLICTDATLRQQNQHTNSRGYVSHSFNQFIQIDGNTVLVVDHGDAYPRAVCIMKYNNSTKEKNFYSGKTTGVNVLNISGNLGANYTGVQVGGFEYSDTNYIIAGNAVTSTNQKNIYVTSTSKTNFSASGSQIIWITNHQSGVKVSNVQLVKINNNSFFLAWTEDGVLTYTFLNQYGQRTGEIYTAKGMLSDCKPIVTNNKIVWYATKMTFPQFFVLDLNNKASVEYVHECDYTYYITTPPTVNTSGIATLTCLLCNESFTVDLPKLNTTDYRKVCEIEPSCGTRGLYLYYWNNTTYGEICTSEWVDGLEHKYGDWETNYEGHCGGTGRRTKYCVHCGEGISENFRVEHNYTDWSYVDADCENDGYRYCFCEKCGDWKQESVMATGHNYDGLYCENCGDCVFVDVVPNEYYVGPVAWAVKENITNGTSSTTFSPKNLCTRAQVVTFIWRACGAPAPEGDNPFTDVPNGEWYTEAVVWAVETGITTGISKDKFAPTDFCTRSQVVTFLYRLNGENKVSASNPFGDVKTGEWYYNAIMWAVKHGITNGTSATTFTPDMKVDRAQVVTFLYRAS